MNRVEIKHLLTAQQMAQFVINGYIVLDEIVPEEWNQAVLKEQKEWSGSGYRFWFDTKTIREIFDLPQVKGITQSMVGATPGYDHSFLHVVKAKHLKGQDYHADSIIDTRPFAFDVQAFYFAHDTPLEMGPTLVLPGSHLRKTSNGSIARYKNILGQKQLACKAGTIALLHQDIWHCAQPNFTDTTRYVFKLRLRPGQLQHGLFNTDGYNSPEISAMFQKGYQPWVGDEGRIEQVNRAKLWRYLVADNSVDVSFEKALTRMSQQ